MTSISNSIKDPVLALRPYTLAPHRASVKLNQNENPWDAPLEIKRETLIRMNDRAWSRYPDFTPQRLHERLAGFSGWQADGIIAGNGSNELIQALLMVTVGEGKRVLITEPTFALYRQITTVLGGEVASVPLSRDLQFNVAALLEEIEETQPAVTIICSPNNPTGCVISDEHLVVLLKAAQGLIVVDEAYHEFADPVSPAPGVVNEQPGWSGGHSAVPLISDHENLVVLRTFSKAMAMAALRVGYLLASPALVVQIAKAVLPYNLNAFSQTAAEVAIEMFKSKLKPLVEGICAERDRLYVELANIPGLVPVKSQANFMVVRANKDPKRVFSELLKRDILIRDVSGYPMLNDYFRVSVGTPAENDLLVRALREILT
ncbi:MAG TPA: histidinol-phosphate transaminase [Pyrinomonadaceae bacterium]|jgi:histidinol-phosphate aminotransferase